MILKSPIITSPGSMGPGVGRMNFWNVFVILSISPAPHLSISESKPSFVCLDCGEFCLCVCVFFSWFRYTGFSLAAPGVLHIFLNPQSLWSNNYWGQLYLDPIPINSAMAEIITAIIWSEDVPWVWCSSLFFSQVNGEIDLQQFACPTQFMYSMFYTLFFKKPRKNVLGFSCLTFYTFQRHNMSLSLFHFVSPFFT